MNYYKTTIAGSCRIFKDSQIYLFWNNSNCFEKQRNAYQILLQYWSDFICSKQWMFTKKTQELKYCTGKNDNMTI